MKTLLKKSSSTRPVSKVVEKRPGFHLELGGNKEIFLGLEKELSFITSSFEARLNFSFSFL